MIPRQFDKDPRLPHDADEKDWPAFVNPDGTVNVVDPAEDDVGDEEDDDGDEAGDS